MSEKMRCAHCGKRFKQTNKKQVFCADCLAKERLAKKNAPALAQTGSGVATRPGAGTSAPAITIVQATPPPEEAIFGSQARNAERHSTHGPQRAPQPNAAPPLAATPPAKRPTAPQQPAKKSAPPEKRARQPRPAPRPFDLTDELRAAIEQRYLELSQPVEFDGIRTRIADELKAPKPVVKQVVRDLRARRQLPSWWELQAYKGSDETLERIRERYLPLLPTPPIGVHKQIASDLQIDAPQVYQAIRRLRAEMKLPQYNPPDSHTSDAVSSEIAHLGSATASTE
ncbi:MAG TPA: FYVE zinc finger domain-containing protein [Ktedonobacterales bacterium]|jgi:hypothetical protein